MLKQKEEVEVVLGAYLANLFFVRGCAVSLSKEKHEKLRKRLLEKLQGLLPCASSVGVLTLIDAFVGLKVPVRSPMLPLLQVKCTASEIHNALVYGRNMMLGVYGQESVTNKARLMPQIIQHFDRLMILLLHDTEALHEQNNEVMQAKLLFEGHERIVSKASYEWKQEKEVQIYNYYKEVPVHAVVKLLSVGEQNLTVKKSRKMSQVFAASPQGDSVLIRLPKNELCMRLTIEEVSGVGVHLRYGGFLSVDKEKRRSIRVQTSKPTVVEVMDAKRQSHEALMCDFSDSGMGLSFDMETPLQPGDEVALSLFMNGQSVRGKGIIAWAKNENGTGSIGVGIEYSNENYRLFSNEVLRRKKAILNELRQLGVPSGLF
ncbi:MAG: PilZ domain-containing protein [Ghiorsea sp.]